jgi:menaquinol-cytochrome c reductase iron-sulfur subunit
MNRRDLYRYGSVTLAAIAALVPGVPGLAYFLDPLTKKSKHAKFVRLAKLSELKVGEPVSVAVIEERQDAWVKYPREPIGSVWLIRQPKGTKPEVVAFATECPHLGCAVNLSPNGKNFDCPCHTSKFDFAGKALNSVPPRPMDKLDVELSTDPDPEVRVKFRRFRAQEKEQIPLV